MQNSFIKQFQSKETTMKVVRINKNLIVYHKFILNLFLSCHFSTYANSFKAFMHSFKEILKIIPNLV